MARIAKRLAGPAQVSNTTATKYTTPANTKTLVRHIHISNPSGSPVTFTLSIGADAAATRLFDAYSIAATSIFDHYCLYVLEEAEIIAAHAGTNNILTLTIDGEESVLS